jgi:hypothetical protein
MEKSDDWEEQKILWLVLQQKEKMVDVLMSQRF